jgi:hypothetical protein
MHAQQINSHVYVFTVIYFFFKYLAALLTEDPDATKKVRIRDPNTASTLYSMNHLTF